MSSTNALCIFATIATIAFFTYVFEIEMLYRQAFKRALQDSATTIQSQPPKSQPDHPTDIS